MASKMIRTEGVELPEGSYKYLGILQTNEEAAWKSAKYLHRVNQVLKSRLNGRNKARAMNTYALPVIRYPADIIRQPKEPEGRRWSPEEIRDQVEGGGGVEEATVKPAKCDLTVVLFPRPTEEEEEAKEEDEESGGLSDIEREETRGRDSRTKSTVGRGWEREERGVVGIAVPADDAFALALVSRSLYILTRF
ncbi:hypothetical protein L3Q82_002672 [Scortum barcoo]|uniref:Uncharacterized protein n=1 Tax=Scortum barcoo TaxID=214431 RepID=A0ACB8VU51_9TELE|nr:hypothetical protein L3Q82_002672 [Scortum barcoo]